MGRFIRFCDLIYLDRVDVQRCESGLYFFGWDIRGESFED